MTSKVYDDGKGTTYTCNAGGQLLTRVWDRGITTTYGYDNAGSQNSIDYSDTTPDISFTYNRMGQLATVTDASGTRTNTYDANLRLASSSIPYILSGNGKLEYAYDTLGRMSSMKLMEDTTQKLINSYTYDAMSRIATVSDGTNTAKPFLALDFACCTSDFIYWKRNTIIKPLMIAFGMIMFHVVFNSAAQGLFPGKDDFIQTLGFYAQNKSFSVSVQIR